MPPELCALMERYCQLGRLLPSQDDIFEDIRVRAEAQIVLREMAQVKARIDAFLAAARAHPDLNEQ